MRRDESSLASLFSLVNLVLYIRRAIPASGSMAYTARLEFHTWHSFCGNIYYRTDGHLQTAIVNRLTAVHE